MMAVLHPAKQPHCASHTLGSKPLLIVGVVTLLFSRVLSPSSLCVLRLAAGINPVFPCSVSAIIVIVINININIITMFYHLIATVTLPLFILFFFSLPHETNTVGPTITPTVLPSLSSTHVQAPSVTVSVTGNFTHVAGGTSSSSSYPSSLCSKRIAITSASMSAILHADINDGGHVCSSPGRVVLIASTSRTTKYSNILRSYSRASLGSTLNILARSNATYVLGIDDAPRVCGNVSKPVLTMSLFVVVARSVVVLSSHLVLHPRVPYLLEYVDTQAQAMPCVYVRVGDAGQAHSGIAQGQNAGSGGLGVAVQSVHHPSNQSEVATGPTTSGQSPACPSLVHRSPSPSVSVNASTQQQDQWQHACFPASALVHVSSSLHVPSSTSFVYSSDAAATVTRKRMDELVTSDELLSYNSCSDGHNPHQQQEQKQSGPPKTDQCTAATPSTTQIYAFSHADAHATALFVRVKTLLHNCSLTVSPGHYVYTSTDTAMDARQPQRQLQLQLTVAHALRVGKHRVMCYGVWDAVSSVTHDVAGVGLFNPQTTSGDLVVDGVWVSAFTMSVRPVLATALLTPVRAGFAVGVGVQLGRWVAWPQCGGDVGDDVGRKNGKISTVVRRAGDSAMTVGQWIVCQAWRMVEQKVQSESTVYV